MNQLQKCMKWKMCFVSNLKQWYVLQKFCWASPDGPWFSWNKTGLLFQPKQNPQMVFMEWEGKAAMHFPSFPSSSKHATSINHLIIPFLPFLLCQCGKSQWPTHFLIFPGPFFPPLFCVPSVVIDTLSFLLFLSHNSNISNSNNYISLIIKSRLVLYIDWIIKFGHKPHETSLVSAWNSF